MSLFWYSFIHHHIISKWFLSQSSLKFVFLNEKFCILKKVCLVQSTTKQGQIGKNQYSDCSVGFRCSGIPVKRKSWTPEKQCQFYINIHLCEVSQRIWYSVREKKLKLSQKVMVVASCIILYISLFIHADSSFQFFPIQV